MADAFEALAASDPGGAAALVQQLKGKIVVPHTGGQVRVIESRARFRVLRAGRRWGKTKLAAREMIQHALARPGSMNWWVANTYKNVRRGYRMILRQLPPSLLAKPAPPSTANELVLQLKNGSTIEFYSGGNPDAMAGEGVDFMIVDEAALIAENVWHQILDPTLLDNPQSRALIISTPRGRNWFWELAQRGENAAFPQYEAFHFTTYDNPYISNAEIDLRRQSMPERLFNQEILAKWIGNAAALINMEKVLKVDEMADPRGQLIAGIDLAKDQDFSVIDVVREEDRMPVYHDRFNDISWPDQKERITETIDMLEDLPGVEGVLAGVDSTGLGDVVFDDLDALGYDVEAVPFTPSKKQLYVKRLAADLENKRAFVTCDQVPEFEAFEYKVTPSGNMTYEAGEGSHDDEVAAKMIQHWVLTHRGGDDVHVESVGWEENDPDEESVPKGPVVADSAHDIALREEAWSRA
jgi:hypothetical protein